MTIIRKKDSLGRELYYKVDKSGEMVRISKNDLSQNQINNAKLISHSHKKSSNSESSKIVSSRKKSREILNNIIDKVESNIEDKIMDRDDISNSEIGYIIKEEVDKQMAKFLGSKTKEELFKIIKDTGIQRTDIRATIQDYKEDLDIVENEDEELTDYFYSVIDAYVYSLMVNEFFI